VRSLGLGVATKDPDPIVQVIDCDEEDIGSSLR